VVEILDGPTVIAKTHAYSAATKTLNWTDPKLTWQIKPVSGGFDLTLSAKTAARGVWIDTGTVNAQLSDNSFDLSGGEIVTIRIRTDVSAAALKKALMVQSYYNSAKVN
jgi:beta-mannosidase